MGRIKDQLMGNPDYLSESFGFKEHVSSYDDDIDESDKYTACSVEYTKVIDLSEGQSDDYTKYVLVSIITNRRRLELKYVDLSENADTDAGKTWEIKKDIPDEMSIHDEEEMINWVAEQISSAIKENQKKITQDRLKAKVGQDIENLRDDIRPHSAPYPIDERKYTNNKRK